METGSPVLHFQADLLALLSQADGHLLAVAVLAGIAQCLLHDAVQGVLEDRREPLELHAAV